MKLLIICGSISRVKTEVNGFYDVTGNLAKWWFSSSKIYLML